MHHFLNSINSLIPSYYLNLTLQNNSLSLTLQSHDDLIEAKTEEFNRVLARKSRDEAVEHIFSNLKHCNFIVFQSKDSIQFFQFGIRKNGFFLDYPITDDLGSKDNLDRTITFFQANGFKETEENSWEYMKYFQTREGEMEVLKVYLKKDIELIKKCFTYFLVEVYKDDIKNFRIMLG